MGSAGLDIKPSNRSLVETIAGLTAGVATTIIVHPLDLIKTRLQVKLSSPSRLGSSMLVAKTIYYHEGGVPAFYRGVSSNLIGNSASWALYFVLYDRLKAEISTYYRTERPLSFYDFFLASGVAGILTAVCTNPIWVIKTRMLSTSATYHGAYSSTFDGVQRIFQAEGLRGFYRGLLPSLFGVSHGAIQFMAYEQLKKYRGSSPDKGQKVPNNLDLLIFSALSKMFAGTITYPYQVIRARMQSYDADKMYKNATDVMIQVWRQEGFSGFYKGLGPNLLRVVPSSCVTFLVYENTKFYLPRLFGDSRAKDEAA